MSKIFRTITTKAKNVIKEKASEIASQGIETVKYTVNEKMNNAVNHSIHNLSDKTGAIFKTSKAEDATVIQEEDSSESFEIQNAAYNDDIYKDEEAFENNVRVGLEGMVSSLAAVNPEDAKEVLNGLVAMAGEVQKFTEVQKTKRKDIESKRDIMVEKIKSQKEMLLSYLEKSFDERKDNFAKLFSLVDNAIENNNMQQLALGLDSINKLADSSPFKALASIEDTRLALENKTQEWDF
jgi:hypothetical protein